MTYNVSAVRITLRRTGRFSSSCSTSGNGASVIFVNENHYLTPGLLAGTFYQVRQLSVNLRIIVFCQVILLIVFPQSLGQILIQFSSGFVYSQFSTTRSGIRAKCPTLAVTITSPFCKAVAPIKRSKSSIRCPWRSNKAFMCP